ncbi:electron transport complex protein RnfC [Klebsiella aerogenes]|nr:electron transport complex protein RnfC [Klebsiella aerogenes]
MQDCAAQIVDGIRILAHILQPDEVLIGIEDNKPQAISMLRAVLCDAHGISLRVIPLNTPPVGQAAYPNSHRQAGASWRSFVGYWRADAERGDGLCDKTRGD